MKSRVMLLTFFLGLAMPGFATLEPASIFSNGAVLQRGMRLPVWGIGDPGKTVTVEFATQRVSTQVNANGTWGLYLEPLSASSDGAPMTITTDSEAVTLTDILVGEVWLCSGQSNMAYPMHRLMRAYHPEFQPYGDYNKKMAEEYTDTLLRFNGVTTVSSPWEPVRSFGADGKLTGWRTAGPKDNPGLSATAFYFGKELREALGDVPVGMIVAAWGGRAIEPFIPQAYWEADPELSPYIAKSQALFEEFKAYLADKEAIDKAMHEWREAHKKAVESGQPRPAPPSDLPKNVEHYLPGAIFNGMIAQLVPYGIRGAIWYQGESNARHDPELYAAHFQGLIQSWRQAWGQGDFPFYYCQLAGFGGWERKDDTPVENNTWSTVSDAQRQMLSLPNTGMAVLKDIGDLDDIHPVNKMDVGKRLSLWALARTYGKDIPVYSGPLYLGSRTEGENVWVTFDHAGSGLSAGVKPIMKPVEMSDEAIDGFQICGPDRKWYWANVEIVSRDTLVVSSPEVADPVEVRYGWKGYSQRYNFYNKEGLPAAVFTTGKNTQ